MASLPPAERQQGEPCRRPQRQPAHQPRAERSQAQRCEAACDNVERSREKEQHEARDEPAARKAEGATERQRDCAPDQPDRTHRRFHQPFRHEFLDRRQQIAADPVGPCAARRHEELALEALEIAGVLDEQGLVPFRNRKPERAFLKRPPQQCRLQIPVAEHRRGRAEKPRVHQGDSSPA